MINESIPGDVKAALDFATRTTEPRVITVTFEGKPEEVLLVGTAGGGVSVNPVRDLLAKHASAPERRVGSIVAHDLTSFVSAVNRDKRPESIIFADVPGRKVVAVLDFHGPADSAPAFGQDRIAYNFQLSAQLLAWIKSAEGGPMDQKTFARLIDDRLGDIGEADPDPASLASQFASRRGIRFATIGDLVAFTRTIAVKSTVESTEVIDENTGDVSIQYSKRGDVKAADGKPVPVPPAFVLQIPILNGLAATQYILAVRLRYDITAAGIAWRIEMHALDKYIQQAVETALDTVRLDAPGGCALPVYLAAIPA